MTVQTAAGELKEAVQELRSAADALRVTACEDAPATGRTMHVDELGEWALELSAAAGAMALEFQALDGAPPDRPSVELVAARVGARHLDFEELFSARAADPGHASEMRILALRPGGAWRGWCRATAAAIADCGPSLARLRRALYGCWRELAQHPEIRLDRATVARLSVIDGGAPASYPATVAEQDV